MHEFCRATRSTVSKEAQWSNSADENGFYKVIPIAFGSAKKNETKNICQKKTE